MTSPLILQTDLRVLLDGSSTTDIRPLIDLTLLRDYLAQLQGPPCTISPMMLGSHFKGHSLMPEIHGVGVLAEDPDSTTQQESAIRAALRAVDQQSNAVHLLAAARAHDVDVVVLEPSPDAEVSRALVHALGISWMSWPEFLWICEIFVRGHEVPWSFKSRTMNVPWTSFYPMNPTPVLSETHSFAVSQGADAGSLELLRSLVYNRIPCLSYTRDKLLFYQLQRAASLRRGTTYQSFSFELGYFLNYYVLLLWAGLDQLAWIINAVWRLGYSSRDFVKVGLRKRPFQERLARSAPELLPILTDPVLGVFQKRLALTRHAAAHVDVLVPGQVYRFVEPPPPDEALDRQVQAENADLLDTLPFDALPWVREVLRNETRLQHATADPELVLVLQQHDGGTEIVQPLVHVESDHDMFVSVATAIVQKARDRLRSAV